MASARYGGSQAAPCEELVYDRQPPRMRPLDCINSGLGQNALNDRASPGRSARARPAGLDIAHVVDSGGRWGS
jgi:hypothetical protein